jgi:hypothetical protein
MKTLFHVKNTTGETWPAYAMARLGAVTRYDGVNADVPLYTLMKPDGDEGIYVVNGGAPLPNNKEGTAIHYLDAQFVLVKTSETASVGTSIGALSGEWTAGSDDENGAQFDATDTKNAQHIIPVVAKSTGGGSSDSSGTGSCPCTCIADGSAIVNGMETASTWSIEMNAETFEGEFGDILFPAGTYDISLNTAGTAWTQDIGNLLTATYLDGSSATADTTMDGTLTMTWGAYGPVVTLCVDGAVPDPEA